MSKKRITIDDVARAAGVSRQTVSRAINDQRGISAQTRERVLKIAHEMNYRPSSLARGLARRRTRTLGLVLPNIANPFFSSIARGIGEVARTNGFSVFLCDTDDRPDQELQAIHTLEEHWVDGMLLCSCRLSDDVLLALAERYRPIVLVNRALDHRAIGYALYDNATGTQEAVRYLVGLGHTKIGMILGSPISRSGAERQRGYAMAMTEAGLSFEPGWMCFSHPLVEGGEQAAKDLLLQCPDLTALVVYNDLRAVGAMRACKEMGLRVPADVSVVGHDDIPLASLVTPTLTTVRIPTYAHGRQAMTLLLKMLQEPDLVPEPRRLAPSLTIRESTAPPRPTNI